jgi:glycosyltransferase involved in cell wall biosynthesis
MTCAPVTSRQTCVVMTQPAPAESQVSHGAMAGAGKVLVYRERLLSGSETFIRNQVLALRRWRPVLIGLKRRDGLQLNGIDVRVLRKWDLSGFSSFADHLAQSFTLAAPEIIRRLKREHASLIHVHFGTDAVRFWPALSRLHMPVLITLHGYDVQRSKDVWENGERSMREYPRRLVAIAEHANVCFLAVSNAIKERAIEYGIPAAKIHVRYIGIDVAEFSPAGYPIRQRPLRIIFIGRLVEKKGAAYLIEAFSQVRKAVPHAELVLVGDGPLKTNLLELAERLSVPVVFKGSLSSAEVREQIHAARILCLPSVRASDGDAEGFGMVLIEAQACGLPVVTSAIGGAQEAVLEGTTGLVFAERDVEGLARHLIRLLLDVNLLESMSVAAVDFVTKNFEIGKCTHRLEALYDSLIRPDSCQPVTEVSTR